MGCCGGLVRRGRSKVEIAATFSRQISFCDSCATAGDETPRETGALPFDDPYHGRTDVEMIQNVENLKRAFVLSSAEAR